MEKSSQKGVTQQLTCHHTKEKGGGPLYVVALGEVFQCVTHLTFRGFQFIFFSLDHQCICPHL